MVDVRTGQHPGKIDRETFSARFRERFVDPAFEGEREALDRIEAIAWGAYEEGRKAPRRRLAGPGFADPSYELSLDWLATRTAIAAAAERHADQATPTRVLVVCGSSRNDGSTTSGKDAAKAKALELAGWSYPKHLSGRAFGVVVHGDAAGTETLRRILCDWLASLELVPAGAQSAVDRYVGYYESYAESHAALDRDVALQEETRNAARAVARAARDLRCGKLTVPDAGLEPPREK